jgi:hypothetical protein
MGLKALQWGHGIAAVETKRYDEVMSRLVRDGAQVLPYDYTRQTPEDIIKLIP